MTARIERQQNIVATVKESKYLKLISRRVFDSKIMHVIFVLDRYNHSIQHGSFTLKGLPKGEGAEVDGNHYRVGSPPINKYGIIINFE